LKLLILLSVLKSSNVQSVFIKQSLGYGLGFFINKGLSFLLIPFYWHFLKPSDFAIIALVFIVIMFTDVSGNLSLDNSITRFYHEWENKRNFLKTYFYLGGMFSFLGAVIIWIVLKHVPNGIIFDNWSRIRPFITYAVLTGFFMSFQRIPLMYLRIAQKVKFFSVYNSVYFVLNSTILILLLAVFHLGLKGYIIGNMLSTFFIFLFWTIYVSIKGRFEFARHKIWDSIKFALPIFPSSISTVFINNGDRIILDRFVSLNSLGVYVVGSNLSKAHQQVLTSFSYSIIAKGHELLITDPKGGQHSFKKLVKTFVFLNAILSILFLSAIIIYVRVFGKSTYIGAIPYIIFFVINNFINGFQVIYGIKSSVDKNTNFNIIIAGATLFFIFVIGPVFGRLVGIWAGIIIAYGLTFLNILITYLYTYKSKFKFFDEPLPILVVMIVVFIYGALSFFLINSSVVIISLTCVFFLGGLLIFKNFFLSGAEILD